MALEYAMFMKRYVRHKITSSPNFEVFLSSPSGPAKIKKMFKRCTQCLDYDYDYGSYGSPFAMASFRFITLMQMTTDDLAYPTFVIELLVDLIRKR